MPDTGGRLHAPERTCIGCRRKTGPGALRRVTRRADGTWALGPAQGGRGAWLCTGSVACFDTAVRRRAFVRALRCEVPGQELVALRERLLSEGDEARAGLGAATLEGVGGA